MEKTLRVGVMPGRINEYVVEVGTSVADVLRMAELSVEGYECKVDGVKIADIENTQVTERTNLILLAKLVKGNMEKAIKVGVMPGRINDYVVEVGTPISQVLRMAELDPKGYDVKVDGVKVENLDGTTVRDTTNLILLARQVKGNRR